MSWSSDGLNILSELLVCSQKSKFGLLQKVAINREHSYERYKELFTGIPNTKRHPWCLDDCLLLGFCFHLSDPIISITLFKVVIVRQCPSKPLENRLQSIPVMSSPLPRGPKLYSPPWKFGV